jgi:hypothetical protein
MYRQVYQSAGYEEVLLVTKRTFIEFRWPEEDKAAQLPRTKSEPLLKNASNAWIAPSTKGGSKLMEPVTPTTCASENGDDIDDDRSLPEVFSEDQMINFGSGSIAWADISDSVEVDELLAQAVSSGIQDKKEKDKRRSGRQRQRENRRRRMRTPSPASRYETTPGPEMCRQSSWNPKVQTMSCQWFSELQ